MNDVDKLIKKIIKEQDIIMICKFGSHMYGTDTPESDVDLKGVFMPTKEQILLGNIPKTISFDSNPSSEKNNKDDIDCELYSLYYFLKMAAKGEMVGVDMLHANMDSIIVTTEIWEDIYKSRSEFYTTEMKSFVSYAKKQAAKYGVKGSRLNSGKVLLDYLKQFDGNTRMSEIWNDLPVDENMNYMVEEPKIDTNDSHCKVLKNIKTFNFCGKQIQSTAKVVYIIDMVQNFYDKYGHRAILAANNEGVDWKAMSHAVRAGLQIKEIFETNDLKYPLKEASFLKRVKQGKFSFKFVLSALENLLEEIEHQSHIVDLRDSVDQKKIDKFIMKNVLQKLMK